MIGKWPCQNLMGGTGAAIYAPDENGLCDHAECEPPSNPKPVKQHEWEKVWVITEWDEGIVDYETGERDADPIEWECRTMYSEAVYDRDIKALLAMIDEFQCTRDSNEFAADLLLRADAALKEGRDHAE